MFQLHAHFFLGNGAVFECLLRAHLIVSDLQLFCLLVKLRVAVTGVSLSQFVIVRFY